MLACYALQGILHYVSCQAGELLRLVRERAGITQEELARRGGTSQAAISRIEAGDTSVTIATLERLLAAMGEQLELISRVAPLRLGHDDIAREAKMRIGSR